MTRRIPLSKYVALAALVVVGAAATACVSRNVEPIGSDEAATLTPPGPESVATPSETAATAAEGSGEEGSGEATAPAEESTIEVTVEVDPEAVDEVPSGATLYLIVRVSGREGGAPMAVKRLPGTLPVTTTIGEADAMMPGTPLVGDLDVVARLDQDGAATTREPGDFEGRVGPVQAGSRVTITLEPLAGDGASPSP